MARRGRSRVLKAELPTEKKTNRAGPNPTDYKVQRKTASRTWVVVNPSYGFVALEYLDLQEIGQHVLVTQKIASTGNDIGIVPPHHERHMWCVCVSTLDILRDWDWVSRLPIL